MKDSRERLIIFTRYPEPGVTKTRLIPILGKKGAANLQKKMTQEVVKIARQLEINRKISLEIRYDGGNIELMKKWLGHDLIYNEQGPGNLGKRMNRALMDGFQKENKKVVIIGGDVPSITTSLLNRSFEVLDKNDLVLGPAEDGGYYLIGLNKDVGEKSVYPLFQDVKWGTDSVLEKTIRISEELGISKAILYRLGDIDRPEDLNRCHELVKDIISAK